MVARFRIPPGYWRRFAAGAAFGIYMSHLLYYLNPQIEISSATLMAINLGYGLYCGILFGSILWGLRLLRRRMFPPEEFKPHGFGIMTFAAWLSAFVYWGHYLTLRIYLPVPAVRDLKRATITIGVAAFLLFILWLFERTAEKRVSQFFFAIGCTLILLAGFLLHQSRESYPFAEGEEVSVTIRDHQPVKPIVVVVISSVAHDWLIELEPERPLPFFHDRGGEFFERVEPFPTASRRSVLASLTTGKLPYRHGVAGHYAWSTPLNRRGKPYLLLPNGVGFSNWGLLPPVSREAAPRPAGHALPVWSIFERAHRDARILSWPGLPESQERATRGGLDLASPRFASLGEHGPAVDATLARDLEIIDQAIRMIDSDTPDLLMLSLDGIERLTPELGLRDNTLPPALTAEGESVRTYLEQTGQALDRLRESIEGGLLIVVSPFAIRPHYAPDDLQSYVKSSLSAHTGDADGFILIVGTDSLENRGATIPAVTDLVPTLLFAADLPVARDMDGRVLTEAFDPALLTRMQLQLLPSYDVKRLNIRIDGERVDH